MGIPDTLRGTTGRTGGQIIRTCASQQPIGLDTTEAAHCIHHSSYILYGVPCTPLALSGCVLVTNGQCKQHAHIVQKDITLYSLSCKHCSSSS